MKFGSNIDFEKRVILSVLKRKVVYLKFLIGVLTELCLYMHTLKKEYLTNKPKFPYDWVDQCGCIYQTQAKI